MKGKNAVWVGISFGIAGLASIHLQAQESFIGIYDFSRVTIRSGIIDRTPPPVAPGVLFGAFRAAGYSGGSCEAGVFCWGQNEPGAISGDDDFSHFTGSLNPAKYYEVTLSPELSCALELDTISFYVGRGEIGIRNYAVRSSLDGFAENLPASISPANPNLGVGPDNSFRWLFDAVATLEGLGGSQVVLGDDFDVLTAPVTFRFYGWNADMSMGAFGIDNVAFSGSVALVPEPAAAALLPPGLIWLWGEARKRFNSGNGKQQQRSR